MKIPRVAIVNYGMGNLDSMRRAVLHVGAETVVTDNPATIMTSDRIILPGVGSFPAAMRNLRERALADVLITAHARSLPILGVCLGMQLLGDSSEEDGGAKGLGIIAGKTVKIVGDTAPHMGWNSVYQTFSSPLFNDIPDRTDFYFCHSYRFQADAASSVIGLTPYGEVTVSAIRSGRTVGVQFHPEKSQKNGLKLLKNFIDGEGT